LRGRGKTDPAVLRHRGTVLHDPRKHFSPSLTSRCPLGRADPFG